MANHDMGAQNRPSKAEKLLCHIDIVSASVPDGKVTNQLEPSSSFVHHLKHATIRVYRALKHCWWALQCRQSAKILKNQFQKIISKQPTYQKPSKIPNDLLEMKH